MRNSAVTQFCKQVGRKLQCTPATRRALLQGLEEELSEMPNAARASLTRLEANVGPVSHVAAELQASVSSEEESRAVQKKHRRIIFVVGCVLGLSLMLILLAIFLFYYEPVQSYNLLPQN